MNESAINLENSVVRKLFWRLLPFLFLLYVVNYLDRINVGFAALQMQKQLGLSDRVYGIGAGIFFAGYFCFQVPSNLALLRVGARRWIAAIMAVWGVLSCCMLLVHTAQSFYTLRFLLGAAEAGFFPGIILYLKQWVPASARARAVALFMTASPVAGVVGSPISGALLGMHQFGIAGWQWMFLIEGFPAVLLAAVVLVTLKDHPRQASWLLPKERDWLMELLARENAPDLRNSGITDLRSLLGMSWKLALLAAIYFGNTSSIYGIVLWLPNFIHSLAGFSNFQIGLVSIVPYFAAAGAMIVVGVRSDRSGTHRLYLCGTAGCAAASLLAATHTASLVPALTLLSVALLATYSMLGPFWATATSLMHGTVAAAGIAIVNSIGNLGGFYGPYIIGARRTSGEGFGGGMIVISALLALACLLSVVVTARQERSSSFAPNPLQ
jgi:MFS transporter, ACS family, tartrate transporter